MCRIQQIVDYSSYICGRSAQLIGTLRLHRAASRVFHIVLCMNKRLKLVSREGVDTDSYLEVSKEEFEDIALESTRTIEIDEFVPRNEIDDLYLVRPYYICQMARSAMMPTL